MHRLALILIFLASPAFAAAPRVVVDIPPVHSLVAQVMEGVGEPVLLLDGTMSPHGGTLRPSQARALAQADLVVWIGEGLTPWLKRAIPGDSLSLLESEGTERLFLREGKGGDVAHGHDHDHDHDHHGPVDPHAWLDPVNARHWIDLIAQALSGMDPANADAYAANAAAAWGQLDALQSRLSDRLDSLRGKRFAIAHDTLRYLEHRFGLEAVAALSAADGAKPRPGRVRALRAALQDKDVTCFLAEPGAPPPARLGADDGIRVVSIDALGQTLEPGAGLYGRMMDALGVAMADCISGR